MRISAPEIEAIVQQAQVPALFNQGNVQAPEAITKPEHLFDLLNNNAKFKDNFSDEEEEGKLRYLGYILISSVNIYRELNITLEFNQKLKNKDLIVLLRSFSLSAKNKIVWQHSSHLGVTVNPYGAAYFTVPPLVNVFNELDKLHGICIFVMKVKEPPEPRQKPIQQNVLPQTSIPANLNIRKRIDTTA